MIDNTCKFLAETFPADEEKMKEFDDFLEQLSLQYAIEFEKDIYENGRFMGFGISANRGIIYTPSDKMDTEVEKQIKSKIMELWYP